MSAKIKYSVLIIGAGNIGALFDTPASVNILTHAHAFRRHSGFNLLGFTDIDECKSKKASELWGCKSFRRLNDAFHDENIDVVCVAVPDEFHYEVLKDLAAFPLKLVFAEKPLTRTLDESKSIMRLYRKKHIAVLMNYSRRFVPEYEKIKKDIAGGRYGGYLTGTGYYGKGLLHNGSHLIDMLRYFIGDVKKVHPVCSIPDFYPDDHSVSAVLRFENGRPFFLQYADCRKYTMFEVDMLFEKKRIRICDLGFKVEEFNVRRSKTFRSYDNIVKTSERSTSLDKALYDAADNIYGFLSEGKALKCSIEDGYKALETCARIKAA